MKTPFSACAPTVLLIFQVLGQENFKASKFHMHLPGSLSPNADRMDIFKQLAKKHGKKAVEETIKILEKINNYNLSQKLRSDLAQITAETNSEPLNSSGIASV
ncbi:uncharacterized protein ACBT44_003741 [Syngnathus typhle]